MCVYVYNMHISKYLYIFFFLHINNISICLYTFIFHIYLYMYLYILRISLALFIYMIYFSTITHCSVGIFHQTGRTPVPDPAAAQLSVALDHTGAAQKRPVTAGVAISPVRKCRNNRLTEIQPINMVIKSRKSWISWDLAL